MTFEIISKYDIADKVKLNNQIQATVLDVKLNLFDNYYKINYLLEFENQERRWTEETAIAEKVE